MPDFPIDKAALAHLSKLARISLEPEEEERLLGDLQSILAYVAELQKADTKGAEPMNGGTLLTNSLRADAEREGTLQGEGKSGFPNTKDGYLTVPKVL